MVQEGPLLTLLWPAWCVAPAGMAHVQCGLKAGQPCCRYSSGEAAHSRSLAGVGGAPCVAVAPWLILLQPVWFVVPDGVSCMWCTPGCLFVEQPCCR